MEDIKGLDNQGTQNVQSDMSSLPAGLQAGLGLAVTSLVLGLIAVSLAIIAVGGLIGLLGLVLAIIHLSKKMLFRKMAVWGLALSILGFLGGTVFGIYYGISIYQTYKTMGEFGNTVFDEYIGSEAPDVTFTDIEGNKIILSELKDKRVILDFWATWCPPCEKEIPHFIKLRENNAPDELAIIGISNEFETVIRDFAKKYRINYPLASSWGQELPEPFDKIFSIPTTFFIDANGVIENVLSGYHSFDELEENALGQDK